MLNVHPFSSHSLSFGVQADNIMSTKAHIAIFEIFMISLLARYKIYLLIIIIASTRNKHQW